jgi:hypothetical protein
MAVKGFGPYKWLLESTVNFVVDETVLNPSDVVVNRSISLLDNEYIAGCHFTKTLLENKTMNASSVWFVVEVCIELPNHSWQTGRKPFLFFSDAWGQRIIKKGVVFKSGISEYKLNSKLLNQIFIELSGKVDDVNLHDDCNQLQDNLHETEETNSIQPDKTRP